MVIDVEFSLAAEPVLCRRVAQMTANRVGRSIYWALTEVCTGRDASFNPGRDAVQGVGRAASVARLKLVDGSRG